MPSFIFVLGQLSPAGGDDQVQLFRLFAGAILGLSAAPLTGVAIAVAMWATFRRSVDWQLKSIIWLVVVLSVFADLRINSVFNRLGV
jgi:hypothetical protein